MQGGKVVGRDTGSRQPDGDQTASCPYALRFRVCTAAVSAVGCSECGGAVEPPGGGGNDRVVVDVNDEVAAAGVGGDQAGDDPRIDAPPRRTRLRGRRLRHSNGGQEQGDGHWRKTGRAVGGAGVRHGRWPPADGC